MCIDRRDFLKLTSGVAGAALLSESGALAAPVPESIAQLKPMTAGIAQITDDERKHASKKPAA
ncbi:MAG: twin-arginine translocation signal domain-containing protein [Acidobacteria bacterium]|nr:twin-arginine translocation signal domain-containing protein [Acidobacteriota bacterium]